MPLAVKLDTLCRKSSAPPRVSAVNASANIMSSAKKSDLKQRKSKINQLSREELDEMLEESKRTYEACKSIKEDFDRSFNMNTTGGSTRGSAKKNLKRKAASKESPQREQVGSSLDTCSSNAAKSSLDQSVDEEVSQYTSNKIDANSSGSFLKSDDTDAMSSGLSSPISLDFDLNAQDNLTQEKKQYYQELKPFSSITIFEDSTSRKSLNDLDLIAFIVRKLWCFYDEFKQFRSEDNHDMDADGQSTRDGPTFKLVIFDVAKLLSKPSCPSPSCFDSELKSRLNELANKLDEHIDIQLADTFADAFQSELVLSLLQPREFNLGDETLSESLSTPHDKAAVDLFEELLFANNLEGVKFISLGLLSFENVMFYHYYFKDNKGLFIEAPICCRTGFDALTKATDAAPGSQELQSCLGLLDSENSDEDSRKNVRIYSACLNHSFFYSVKYLLDAIAGKKNVIFKSSKLGFPTSVAAISQSQAKANVEK